MEHRIEACPFVHILDAPVPQGGNQLVEAFRYLDLHIPEQVIEVPKISSSRRRCRRRRVPVVQTAEQLVDVLEFVSFTFLFQQQIADDPGRPQGLLPAQELFCLCGSRSWTLQFLMVVVGLIREVFKVHAQDRIQQRLVGQNTLKFQFLKVVVFGRGLLSACPDTNSAASFVRSGAADEFFPGSFRTFSRGQKKCDVGSALGVGTECGLYFMDAGGLWRAHGARASAGGGG